MTTVAAVQLGPVAEIPLGEGRAYAAAGEQIAVFRPRGSASTRAAGILRS